MSLFFAIVLKTETRNGCNGAFSVGGYTKCNTNHQDKDLTQHENLQLVDTEGYDSCMVVFKD